MGAPKSSCQEVGLQTDSVTTQEKSVQASLDKLRTQGSTTSINSAVPWKTKIKSSFTRTYTTHSMASESGGVGGLQARISGLLGGIQGMLGKKQDNVENF